MFEADTTPVLSSRPALVIITNLTARHILCLSAKFFVFLFRPNNYPNEIYVKHVNFSVFTLAVSSKVNAENFTCLTNVKIS